MWQKSFLYQALGNVSFPMTKLKGQNKKLGKDWKAQLWHLCVCPAKHFVPQHFKNGTHHLTLFMAGLIQRPLPI